MRRALTILLAIGLLMGGCDEFEDFITELGESVATPTPTRVFPTSTPTPTPHPVWVYLQNAPSLISLDCESYDEWNLSDACKSLGPELEVWVSPPVTNHTGELNTIVHIGPEEFYWADEQQEEQTKLIGGWVTLPHRSIEKITVRLSRYTFSTRPSDTHFTCERTKTTPQESVFLCAEGDSLR